jgi:predicted nucleic acid-binding protein
MILVDTNVISQPLREGGEQKVISWLDANDMDIFIPAQSIAELVYGYEKLEISRRRLELHDAVFAMLTRYRERVVSFDQAAAEAHGWLTAKMEKAGTPLPFSDSQIAAIAISRAATVATRNTRDFSRTGVEIVNPWES